MLQSVIERAPSARRAAGPRRPVGDIARDHLAAELAAARAEIAVLGRRLARQEALNGELVHRVKNNLTLLLSLVRAERRKAPDAAAAFAPSSGA